MENPLETYTPPVPPPKSKVGKILAFGCGLPIGILVLLIIIGAVVGPRQSSKPGSAGSTTSSAATQASLAPYLGKWTGADGTTMWIRNDGKGDFNAGSTKVDGGGVTLDETAKTLEISGLFGIGKTWSITKAPSRESSEMTLDGTVFKRTGGFDSSESEGSASTVAAPPAAECDKLAKGTLAEFDKALATGDFGGFYRGTSQVWQKQTSAAELKSAFKPFLDQKMRLDGVLSHLKPSYEAPRVLETDAGPELVLKGVYPSRPSKLRFEIGYLQDGGEWRPMSLKVHAGN